MNAKNVGGIQIQDAEIIDVEKLQARCTRLRKNLGVAAKLISNKGPRQAWMVTLTYADAYAWKPKHVTDALRLFRAWSARRGFRPRYLWVMEVQDRKSGHQIGAMAPHYHLVVWLPHGVEVPKFDTMGWWKHGMTNSVKAVAAVRYVMKYASKFDSVGCFPKGARVYGIGGLDHADCAIRRWVNWPRFVQNRASVSCDFKRARGGGWVDGSTGEVFPSEWGLVYHTRTGSRLLRLRRHPVLIHADGPFSWCSQP